MDKRIFTVVFVSALIIAMVGGAAGVQVAKANFIPTCMIQAVSLGGSPVDFYGQWTILRDFTFDTPFETRSLPLRISVGFVLTANRTISYSVDGGANVSVSGHRYSMDELWKGENVTATLPPLANGLHRVDIYAESIPVGYAAPDYRTIHFTISSTEPASPPTMPLPTPTHPRVATRPPAPTIPPATTPLPTPSPSALRSPSAAPATHSPSPSVPEFPTWIVLPMLASAVAAVAVAQDRRKR